MVVAVAAALLAVPLASARLVVTTIYYNPPGRDVRAYGSLSGEWIQIWNNGARGVAMRGWKIRDLRGNVYRFPAFTLRPGKFVTVHTGRGRGGGGHVFWGRRYEAWNNTGYERAAVVRPSGAVENRCAYTATRSGMRQCVATRV